MSVIFCMLSLVWMHTDKPALSKHCLFMSKHSQQCVYSVYTTTWYVQTSREPHGSAPIPRSILARLCSFNKGMQSLSCRPCDEVPSGGHTDHGGNQGVQD